MAAWWSRSRISQGSAGAMPIATCHFCNSQSRLVPPTSDDHINTLIASKSPFPEASTQYALSTGTLQDWLCTVCTCWNQRNEREPGGMSSWNEAMADTTPNSNITDIHAAAREAASSSPSLCHTCRTHHALLRSLLSSYYPADCTPAQEAALDDALPAYTASITHRYPPLCATCAPKAEEVIRRADMLARRDMWGGWLDRSSEAAPSAQGNHSSEAVWRLRGAAWGCSTAVGLALSAVAAVLEAAPVTARYLLYSTPVSLLWAFWDPLWLEACRARRRTGPQRVKVHGRDAWIRAQAMLLACRVVGSILVLSSRQLESIASDAGVDALSMIRVAHVILVALQLSLLISSYAGLSLQAPARMRLVSSSIPADSPPRVPAKRRPLSNSSPTAKDPFSALTLASADPLKAVTSASGSSLGEPLLPLDELFVPTPRKRVGLSPSPELEEMDWTPTPASATKITSPPRAWPSTSANFQLGPQRFFPPEASTGLDDAFSQALDFKREDSPARVASRHSETRSERLKRERRARNLSLCFAFIIGAAAVLLWLLRDDVLASFGVTTVKKQAMQGHVKHVPVASSALEQ